MTAIYAPIDKRVRSQILHRARQAASLDCMPDIIYDAIVAFNVDYRSVELDEIKSVLVDAVRAYREQLRQRADHAPTRKRLEKLM